MVRPCLSLGKTSQASGICESLLARLGRLARLSLRLVRGERKEVRVAACCCRTGDSACFLLLRSDWSELSFRLSS